METNQNFLKMEGIAVLVDPEDMPCWGHPLDPCPIPTCNRLLQIQNEPRFISACCRADLSEEQFLHYCCNRCLRFTTVRTAALLVGIWRFRPESIMARLDKNVLRYLVIDRWLWDRWDTRWPMTRQCI